METEQRKFAIFLENLKIADLRNAAELKNGGSAVHGITKLSDLSQAEFQAKFLTSDVRLKSEKRNVVKIGKEPDTTSGLVDWEAKLTTPVKNQVYPFHPSLSIKNVALLRAL